MGQQWRSFPQSAIAARGGGGGAYIPPFKLAALMKDTPDKTGPEYQRMTWDALRKSINGLVNKVNAVNIKAILPEFFQEVRPAWRREGKQQTGAAERNWWNITLALCHTKLYAVGGDQSCFARWLLICAFTPAIAVHV